MDTETKLKHQIRLLSASVAGVFIFASFNQAAYHYSSFTVSLFTIPFIWFATFKVAMYLETFEWREIFFSIAHKATVYLVITLSSLYGIGFMKEQPNYGYVPVLYEAFYIIGIFVVGFLSAILFHYPYSYMEFFFVARKIEEEQLKEQEAAREQMKAAHKSMMQQMGGMLPGMLPGMVMMSLVHDAAEDGQSSPNAEKEKLAFSTMNETQLEAELAQALKNEDYDKARMIQEALDKIR